MLDVYERETVGVLGVCGWALAWVFISRWLFCYHQSVVTFWGWVFALVTRTRHLNKFVRGGDSRHGGRFTPAFFSAAVGTAGSPGDRHMTEPGDATGRQHEKTPNTRRAPRFFSGSPTAAVVAREQKRCGRTPPASDAWTTAIGFAGGQGRPKKCGAPAAGRKAWALAWVWEVARVVG